MLDGIWYDFRFVLRLLRRNLRNTLLIVAILGVGIGANTAMFSAISYVLIRPLPFDDDAQLVRLRDAVVGADGAVHPFNMRSRDVLAVQKGVTAFSRVAAFSSEDMILTGGEHPQRLSVVYQAGEGQETLGVRPVRGRSFTQTEQERGASSGVAIISDSLWQSRFGGAPSALGATLQLDNRTYSIVGIMAPQYQFPYEAQVWLPFTLDPSDAGRDFAVFARIKKNAPVAQMKQELNQVTAQVRSQYPDVLPSQQLEWMPIRESLISAQTAPLRAMSDVVAFLLLLASLNVATLLLAHSVTRRREFAIRAALGASRARHIRQRIAESAVLAVLGCAFGLLLVAWMRPLTSALMPSVLSGQLGLTTPRTDWRVLLFAIAVTVATAIIAGVAPALGSWRVDVRAALSDGGRSATAGLRHRKLLGVLIVAEVAFTLVLLAGSGLVIRNFVQLSTLPLGFEARGLLTVELSPSPASPPGPVRAGLIARLTSEIRRAPGVVNAAVTTVNPLGGGTWSAPIATPELAARDAQASIQVNDRLITPSLFDTMGIRLVRGRSFTDQDRTDSASVVIVSERLARRLWPDEDPIGKRARVVRPGAPWLTVVGVAGDVSDSHDPGVPLETWYRPIAQYPASPAIDHFYIMVRSSADALALVPSVERAIGQVDKSLAPYRPAAMDQYRKRSLSREETSAALMLGFGLFGLVLAAIGTYGVTGFALAQRTGEFGIRMALGAGRGQILPLILGRYAKLILGGALFGAGAAVALNRVLATFLSGIGALDVFVVGIAALLVILAALVSCLPPLIRALRMDALAALRAN